MVRPGSGRFGVGFRVELRAWDFPTEIVLSRTRTHLVPLNYWDRGSEFFCGGAYYGTLGSMEISIETLKKKNPFKNRMAHNRQKGGSWLSATP